MERVIVSVHPSREDVERTKEKEKHSWFISRARGEREEWRTSSLSLFFRRKSIKKGALHWNKLSRDRSRVSFFVKTAIVLSLTVQRLESDWTRLNEARRRMRNYRKLSISFHFPSERFRTGLLSSIDDEIVSSSSLKYRSKTLFLSSFWSARLEYTWTEAYHSLVWLHSSLFVKQCSVFFTLISFESSSRWRTDRSVSVRASVKCIWKKMWSLKKQRIIHH